MITEVSRNPKRTVWHLGNRNLIWEHFHLGAQLEAVPLAPTHVSPASLIFSCAANSEHTSCSGLSQCHVGRVSRDAVHRAWCTCYFVCHFHVLLLSVWANGYFSRPFHWWCHASDHFWSRSPNCWLSDFYERNPASHCSLYNSYGIRQMANA